MRNLRFIMTLFKLRLARSMVFRLSFFGALFIDGSLFILQLLMFNAIYSQVDTIGGWVRGEVLVFVGTFSLVNAINMTVFFFGLIEIPYKVQNGALDHYLTKPMNPLLRLTFESIDIGSSPLILLSIVIILYGVTVQGAVITPQSIILYIVFILLMTLLWYDLSLIMRTISLFVIAADTLFELEGSFIELCMKIPGVVFQGVYKLLFCFLLPYGLIATVPTQILLGTTTPAGILYAGVIVLIFTVFAQRFWRFGLKRYKSASS